MVRSQTDLEAYRQHELLLSANAKLLETVTDLSKRLERHSICRGTCSSRMSVVSVPVTEEQVAQEPSLLIDLAKQAIDDDWAIWAVSSGISYEDALAGSVVYRKAEGKETVSAARPQAWSLKSSAPTDQSRAWTALTSVSLSQISKVSLIALPVSQKEIRNARYNFDAESTDEDYFDAVTLPTDIQPQDAMGVTFRVNPAIGNETPVTMKLLVIGSSTGMPETWTSAVRRVRAYRPQ